MIAEFVGLLTIILAVWTWRVEKRRWLRFLGLAALATVIVQGILGGLTVLFFLPAHRFQRARRGGPNLLLHRRRDRRFYRTPLDRRATAH